MHFSVLFILEGFKKEDLSNEQINEMFYEEFCNQEDIDNIYEQFGEDQDKLEEELEKFYDQGKENICDWFELGGRWTKQLIKTEKGKGRNGEWYGLKCLKKEELEEYNNKENWCDIANIEDIVEIYENGIHNIAMLGGTYYDTENCLQKEEWKYVIKGILDHKIKGCVAIIDCHI